MDDNFRFNLLSVSLYEYVRGKEIEKLESDAECLSWLIGEGNRLHTQGACRGVS